MKKAAKFIPVDKLWINPDCGLKTRDWPETQLALQNMVKAATILRDKYLAQTNLLRNKENEKVN